MDKYLTKYEMSGKYCRHTSKQSGEWHLKQWRKHVTHDTDIIQYDTNIEIKIILKKL